MQSCVETLIVDIMMGLTEHLIEDLVVVDSVSIRGKSTLSTLVCSRHRDKTRGGSQNRSNVRSIGGSNGRSVLPGGL